jgi:ribosomal protein L16 Arg81 hydroxylase
MATHDLTGLLSPYNSEEFLRTCWGRQHLHVPGARGKFSDLLPWPALNQILEQHRLDTPRIRLTREGKPIRPESFLSYHANRRRPNQPIARIRAADLTTQLRDGATLVLDAVDELHAPITQLAESLERVFRVRIQVNAYAGWRTSHGFDLHWDDHDVFVLQVAGRKQWQVYGMTRKYPLARDVEPTVDKPDIPLWEGMLADGDLLYIPRGWWHVATPLDEPTLHLTVGVNNPNGADFLAWYVDRLKASEDVRRDLPQFGCADEQNSLLDRLRDLLLQEWRPDLIQEFLSERDAKSRPRSRVNLPWGAMPDVLPPEDQPFRVRWSDSRKPRIEGTNGEVHVFAQGRRWRFASAASQLIEMLATGQPLSMADLAIQQIDPQTVRTFVRELAINGLIVVL